MFWTGRIPIFMLSVVCAVWVMPQAVAQDVPETVQPVFTFPIDQPLPDHLGGILVHDLTGDGRLDLLMTSTGHVGAYDHSGTRLWVKELPIRLFEWTHHPSLAVGDMDGDGQPEVAFLTSEDTIQILDGRTGETKRTIGELGQPTAIAIANLRGKGDRELLLQYSQTSVKALDIESGTFLWETEAYRGIEHSPLRQADLDGDGMDEIAGASIIDHDGTLMNEWDLGEVYVGMDSMVIADVIPGYPLEVVLAEQRGAHSRTDVVNHEKILFCVLNPWDWEDPDKVAVGDFDPRPGLEIFNRSSGGDGTTPRGREEPFRYELAPWVLDAEGNLLSKYYLNDKKPEEWTGHGIEVIFRIDWDGDDRDEIAAKERHTDGAGAILDPVTGAFQVLFPAKAMRLYVADVTGDYREEVVILDAEGTIKVFSNTNEPKQKDKPRYWEQQHYRRQKQNWNYYSP